VIAFTRPLNSTRGARRSLHGALRAGLDNRGGEAGCEASGRKKFALPPRFERDYRAVRPTIAEGAAECEVVAARSHLEIVKSSLGRHHFVTVTR
jgi:hypothetical protein